MSRSSTKLSVGRSVIRARRAAREESTTSSAWPAGMEFPLGRSSDCDDWCKPLHLVEEAIKGEPWAEYFDVDDFMIMSRLTDSHGTITHYKHWWTRQYINVDNFGTTYAYDDRHFASVDKRYGYSNSQRLRSSVEALRLREAAVMKGLVDVD